MDKDIRELARFSFSGEDMTEWLLQRAFEDLKTAVEDRGMVPDRALKVLFDFMWPRLGSPKQQLRYQREALSLWNRLLPLRVRPGGPGEDDRFARWVVRTLGARAVERAESSRRNNWWDDGYEAMKAFEALKVEDDVLASNQQMRAMATLMQSGPAAMDSETLRNELIALGKLDNIGAQQEGEDFGSEEDEGGYIDERGVHMVGFERPTPFK